MFSTSPRARHHLTDVLQWVSCSASMGDKRGYAYYTEHSGAYTVPSGACSFALGAWIDGFKLPQGKHQRM